MRFTIDKTILEQMLNYLVSKPYGEVAQMITNVQQDIKVAEDLVPSATIDSSE